MPAELQPLWVQVLGRLFDDDVHEGQLVRGTEALAIDIRQLSTIQTDYQFVGQAAHAHLALLVVVTERLPNFTTPSQWHSRLTGAPS